jgi:hypothetical protein
MLVLHGKSPRSSLVTDQIKALREATRRARERHPLASEFETLGEFGETRMAQ